MNTHKFIKLVVLSFLVLISSAALATTYYVDPNGSDDANGGSSWEDAFATIKYAVERTSDETSDIINVAAGEYSEEPILLKSNLEIIFEEGTLVKAEPNAFSGMDAMFKAVSKDNIVLGGNGSTFQGNRYEYTDGDGREPIAIYSCTNVNISGLTLKDSCGDGIYIGYDAGGTKNYCENITISDVDCNNNRRCAIGVISVDGLTVTNCIFKNTNGADPQAGIDFEPNYDFEVLKNISISSSSFIDNNSVGIAVAVGILNEQNSLDVNISFQDIFVSNSPTGIGIWGHDHGPGGEVVFRNVIVEKARYANYLCKSSRCYHVTFENCIWKDFVNTDEINYPIAFWSNDITQFLGGVTFANCQVYCQPDKPVVFTCVGGNELSDVNGDVYIYNPDYTGPLYDWNWPMLKVNNDVTANFYSGITSISAVLNNKRPALYTSIQSAIEEADSGDDIIVYPNTYYENVDFNGKAITLTGIDPNDWNVVNATVIDGNGASNTIVMSYGTNPLLSGLTVTGGAGGIYVSTSTVSNCIIANNSGEGVRFSSGNGTLTNCIVRDNGDKGISVSYGNTTIKNSLIYNNDVGVETGSSCSVIIRNCTVVNNAGYGIIKTDPYSIANISNCILWNNLDDLNDCNATYSCIEDGDSGTGNISSYPYFADYDANDFHVTWNSPCINRGDPNGDYSSQYDIDGENRIADERFIDSCIDIGADEFYFLTANIAKNSDFEEESGINGVPAHWAKDNNCVSTMMDSDEKHSGNYSWRFDNDDPCCSSGGRSDYIAVEPNTYYYLSAWAKCKNGSERVYLGWNEYRYDDSNGFNFIRTQYFVLHDGRVYTKWAQYQSTGMASSDTTYVKILFFAPAGSIGTVWWDDIQLVKGNCLFESFNPFLYPYGFMNEVNVVESIDFGIVNDNSPNCNGGISWNLSAMSDSYTDSNDNNITYRELKKGETLTMEFSAFNLNEGYDANNPNDMNSLPLTPMLLEIMYKDTCNSPDMSVYSKIDYINLAPTYSFDSNDRYYYITYLGGKQDNKWKYIQYPFQKSYFQLLRAINGKFTIRIKNITDSNLPIDYVSLRKITQTEYESFANNQRTSEGFYFVEMPDDKPMVPCEYADPNITIFVRDIMRPVYGQTKPELNEPNGITAFSAWGEVEPASFAMYSKSGMENITISASNLINEQDTNDFIDSNDIQLYRVVYDMCRLTNSKIFSCYVQPNDYKLIPEKSCSWLPDRLEGFGTLSLAPDTSQRIWLKIHVPKQDANLQPGLYKGSIIIKENENIRKIVPIELTIYDFSLERPGNLNPVYHDPFTKAYSNDMNTVFDAYVETGFDPFFFSEKYRILATRDINDSNEIIDPNNIIFNTELFEEALDRVIEEQFVKDLVFIWIPWELTSEIRSLVVPSTVSGLWNQCSDPNFVIAFGLLIEKYKEIGNSRNISFVFNVNDEPGYNVYFRIEADRLYHIIKDANSLTYSSYIPNCDNALNPGSFYVGTSDGNIPPLTNLVDYKAWYLPRADEGYCKHNDFNDPNYHGVFGYYTTFFSSLRNPIYNRFLHGYFAFGTDAKVVAGYAMGDYVSDPYNDFDGCINGGISSAWYYMPDFIYAYPTWEGKLLFSIGGLEGIREGIKDSKYISTLQKLIKKYPNNPVSIEATNYLNLLKRDKIDPHYIDGYVSKATVLGYYGEILKKISDQNNPDDFEAFTRIRKNIAGYIVLLSSLASEPNPADGAEDVNTSASISWKPGKGALSYDVYLGVDYNDVNDANITSPRYMGNYDVNSFDPNVLEYYTTYYWRIDSESAVGKAKGNVWSFSTKACTVDFEDFTAFADYWLETGSGLAFDFDDDNDIDAADLRWFTTYWLSCCPADWPFE